MGTNRCSTSILEKEHAARTIPEDASTTGTKPAATVSSVTFGLKLRIGMGCSGGRHRSGIVADVLAETLRAQDMAVNIIHRAGSIHQ